MKPLFLLFLLWPQEADPFREHWKPVDLDLKEVETRAAFEALFKRAGTRLELPETLVEKKISYQAKGAPFWRVVDDLGRLNGELRHPQHPYKEPSRHLRSAPWVEYPAAYRGPLRMSVFDTARVRELRFPDRGDRTDVTFILQWVASFEPVKEFGGRAGKIRVLRMEDDTGKSLLPERGTPGELEGRAGYMGMPACYWPLCFGSAAAEAKKIARIDVEWEGSFLSGMEDVTFEKPAESVGKSRRVGPMTVTLTEFGKDKGAFADKDTLVYGIRLSFDPETAPQEWKKALEAVPLRQRLLDLCRVTVRENAGEPRDRDDSLYETRIEETVVEFQGSVTLPEGTVTAVTVRAAKGVGSAKTAFEFKEVRLPEESR